MPTGSRGSRMAMSDMTQWTEEELQQEFGDREGVEGGTEKEGGGRGQKGEGRGGSGSRSTPSSTEGRSTSSGSLTPSTSIPSLSDVPACEDQEDREGEGAVAEEEEEEGKKRKLSAHSLWHSVRKAGTGLNQDTRRMFRFIGRKLHRHHEPRKTKVKEIHIVPGEEDDGKWARRMAGGGGHSASSSGSDHCT
ncbi:uncharacterized protein LOC143275221 [Babylonia areolata]|uniref:uncharacterized protein LOC143275221 n=1 Tax=Babylonia areolata TaxID=304850 RepID=UPI003FD2D0F6